MHIWNKAWSMWGSISLVEKIAYMGWSFWQLRSYALAELSHVSGKYDPARPDVSGRARESLPPHIYIPASETSPLAPRTHMLTHCPENKADFREYKGGSPLEGKFTSNPWK
jgi:hypothetical protein